MSDRPVCNIITVITMFSRLHKIPKNFILSKAGQCMYKVILKHVRVTIVVAEKQ
jgi:hypothetical protein